ncbi:MAG: FecR family protein [Saprospiraceae bacterium]
MEAFDEQTDALIARQLAGETTPEEAAALLAWAGESPENQRYLADLVALWQKAPALRPVTSRSVDTEAALLQVKTRLRQTRPRMVRMAVVWRAAAAVVFTLAASYFLWLRNTPPPGSTLVATNTAVSESLSDGSLVTLEPHSGLSLDAGFNARDRRLRLHGAATFDVQSDSSRPFIVALSDLEVQVLGTVFRVDNLSESDLVRITVTSGKVRVSARGQSLLLAANDQAIYNLKSGVLTQDQSLGRVLRFDASPLREVVQQIEHAYGVRIILKNKLLEDCLLTARYNNLSADRVLALIAESFAISLKKSPDAYELDGIGCD